MSPLGWIALLAPGLLGVVILLSGVLVLALTLRRLGRSMRSRLRRRSRAGQSRPIPDPGVDAYAKGYRAGLAAGELRGRTRGRAEGLTEGQRERSRLTWFGTHFGSATPISTRRNEPDWLTR